MRPNFYRYPVSLAVGLSLLAVGSVIACTDITTLSQENPGALSGSTLYVPANAAFTGGRTLIGA